MAVPKKRTSRRRRDMRRAHDHLQANAAVDACSECGEPRLRHHACDACGSYRGRQVAGGDAN